MSQHYVVKGVRTVNRKTTTVWLHWDPEGGGWYQWIECFTS